MIIVFWWQVFSVLWVCFFFFFFGNKHVSFTVKCASSSKKIPNLSNLKFGKRKKRKKAQSVGFFFFANSRHFQNSYKVFVTEKKKEKKRAKFDRFQGFF